MAAETDAMQRSTSTTSSLDPYYFGLASQPDSPPSGRPSKTPDSRHYSQPATPARDPSGIDRRGLIGVGELATPRWTRTTEKRQRHGFGGESEEGHGELAEEENMEVDSDKDSPDSPWTIEAFDSDKEEVRCFSHNKLMSFLIVSA